MPNNWYNGRGFSDGVYYAKDLLEEKGLLDKVTKQLILQYSVDNILYNEHRWDNPLANSGKNGPEFFWQATADHLNTTGKSIMLCLLVGADSPEKARDLQRLKSWMENISLNYSPAKRGTLKPDGSWFHHWGNRWGNYGWVAGWRGATEFVWWMSHTPFQLNQETMERMHHMADVHFKIMNKDGHVGPQDAMHKIPAEGFMNLAMAGTADGSKEIEPVMGSYWFAYPGDKSYRNNTSKVNKVKDSGVVAALKKDSNHTMSYDISNVHRSGDWQVYTYGVATGFYHTQYERDGFLFYNIGGISLCKEGEETGMQNKYGSSLQLRYDKDEANITPGYNFSRAPGVTSVQSDYSKLLQIYYQKGSSDFVGGVSTKDGNGVFVQEFNARNSSQYSGKVAGNLRFKKSYFYFGDNIVMLASGISNGGSNTAVETGLLQEPVSSGKNEFTFANNVTTTGSTYNETYSSTDVAWMLNNTHKTGVFLMPNQNYKLLKGSQTFGPSTGNIISTYLTHDGQSDGWYECILSLNSSKTKMQELATSMQSDKPAYTVLKRDAKLHVVRSNEDETTGYAFFDPSGADIPEGILKTVNKQCVIMLQEGKQNLSLSVASPDKNLNTSSANPLGWSMPIEVTMELNGKYKIINAPENISVEINHTNKTTTVKAIVKDGLTSEVLLSDAKAIEVGDYKETFTNLTDDGGVMSKAFDGDNSIEWFITDATYATDQGDGAGVSIESGSVSSETISSGIKNLSVDLYNKSNTDAKAVKVGLYVNGNLVGTSENTSNNTVYTYTVSDIDVNGKVNIEIKNLSEETTTVVIDNITWKTMPKVIIPVQTLTLSDTEVDIEQFMKKELITTITPDDVTDMEVEWSSDKPEIATVNSEGVVTAISPGVATITVTANPGNKTASCTFTISKAEDATYTETFEKTSKTGWISESYVGDNGFEWIVDGKCVKGYIDGSKGFYVKNKLVAESKPIPGGISSFSIQCKNKWTEGKSSNIELLVNGKVVGSKATTTDNVEYKFEVTDINIVGDVTIGVKIGSETTIAVDNITWTTYKVLTDIEKNTYEHSVSVFPNPFSESLTVKTNGEFNKAVLLDANGRLVEAKEFAGSNTIKILSKSSIPHGVYFLQLIGDNDVIIRKVIHN